MSDVPLSLPSNKLASARLDMNSIISRPIAENTAEFNKKKPSKRLPSPKKLRMLY